MAYNGSRAGQSAFVDYRQLINSPAHWITEDGSGSQHINGIQPDVPFGATSFTTLP